VTKSFLERITGADMSKCMSEDAAGLVWKRAANYGPMQKRCSDLRYSREPLTVHCRTFLPLMLRTCYLSRLNSPSWQPGSHWRLPLIVSLFQASRYYCCPLHCFHYCPQLRYIDVHHVTRADGAPRPECCDLLSRSS
jgi:hypothetical protein